MRCNYRSPMTGFPFPWFKVMVTFERGSFFSEWGKTSLIPNKSSFTQSGITVHLSSNIDPSTFFLHNGFLTLLLSDAITVSCCYTSLYKRSIQLNNTIEIGLGHTVLSVFLRFKIATFGIRHSRQPTSCVAQ